MHLLIYVFSLVTSDCHWSDSRWRVPKRSECSEQHTAVTLHASLTFPGVISFRKGLIQKSIEFHLVISVSLESGACKRRGNMFYYFSVHSCLLGEVIITSADFQSLTKERTWAFSSTKQTMVVQSS